MLIPFSTHYLVAYGPMLAAIVVTWLTDGRDGLRELFGRMLWAFWHLPMFFYSYDFSIAVGFLFGLLAGTITFTWLYTSTGGSTLIVAVWHGAFNFTTACVPCKTGVVAAFLSALVMVWAAVVAVWFKPATLSRADRQAR